MVFPSLAILYINNRLKLLKRIEVDHFIIILYKCITKRNNQKLKRECREFYYYLPEVTNNIKINIIYK